VSAADQGGWTPIDDACGTGHMDVVMLLATAQEGA
jgi:hypothetical protein